MPELYNIADTAPKLKISEITLRRLIKKRAIPFHKIGKKYFFTDDDIKTYLAKIYHPIIEETK